MRLSESTLQQTHQLKTEGYRVVAVAASWRDSQVLLASVTSPTVPTPAVHKAIAANALVQRVEEGMRTGVPFFDQPTVLVLGGASPVPEAGQETRWQTVLDAAERSPNPVVFLQAAQPVTVSKPARRPGM